MKPWLVDDRYERMRGCTRKRKFTAGAAHKVARKYGQRTIHCNWCGGWHCTSRKS